MAVEDDFQPAISRWGHTWRTALVLLISAFIFGGVAEGGGYDGRLALIIVDITAGVVAFAAMFFRRRHPLAIAIATSALTAVSSAAGGPATLAMTSLATRREARPVSLAAATNAVAGGAFVLLARAGDTRILEDVFGIVIPLAAMIGWGFYVGSRRELLWNLRQRAERAEADQEARANEARATERTRIAREMHDVVAHRISQVSMRAGALAYRHDLSVDEMRAQSEVIRDTANEALRDLRSVLHVLRDPSTGTPIEQPQPTHHDIPALIDDARRAGARIDLEIDEGTTMPAEIGRTLYRIVQEGVTNASKHAPAALISIRLADACGDDGTNGIALTMTNPLGFAGATAPGSGLGLVGIAERVAVAGGTFEHHARGGQFVLRAWLPHAS